MGGHKSIFLHLFHSSLIPHPVLGPTPVVHNRGGGAGYPRSMMQAGEPDPPRPSSAAYEYDMPDEASPPAPPGDGASDRNGAFNPTAFPRTTGGRGGGRRVGSFLDKMRPRSAKSPSSRAGSVASSPAGSATSSHGEHEHQHQEGAHPR